MAGVGLHPFGRFPDKTLRSMASEAVVRALEDAGLGVKDVQMAFFANSLGGLLSGQESLRGEVTLHDCGLAGIPIVNVENACASGSSALWLAVRAVRSGEVNVAIAVGAEQMYVGDTKRTLAALQTASDTEVTAGQGLQFVGLYAMRLQERINGGSLTPSHLARVTVKSKACGAANPFAQFGRTMTEHEVLAARGVAGPLTLPMVAAISDGAAAVVLTSRPISGRSAVVLASVLGTGVVDGIGEPVVRRTVAQAYQEASLGPEDLGLAEVHDAVSPAELFRYEELGLCEVGEAAALLDSGATAIGGRIPVNTSGGLASRGHPIGATGLAQIAEVVWQLRGEAGVRQVANCRVGMTQNSGGWVDGDAAVSCVHILAKNA
ncbi:MAG: thiolase family protein [Candidatus Dormibacteria bacterium]